MYLSITEVDNNTNQLNPLTENTLIKNPPTPKIDCRLSGIVGFS